MGNGNRASKTKTRLFRTGFSCSGVDLFSHFCSVCCVQIPRFLDFSTFLPPLGRWFATHTKNTDDTLTHIIVIGSQAVPQPKLSRPRDPASLLLSRVSTPKKTLNFSTFAKTTKKKKKNKNKNNCHPRLLVCFCVFCFPSFFMCVFLSVYCVVVTCRAHGIQRLAGRWRPMRRTFLLAQPRRVRGPPFSCVCETGTIFLPPSFPLLCHAPTCFRPCGRVCALRLGLPSVWRRCVASRAHVAAVRTRRRRASLPSVCPPLSHNPPSLPLLPVAPHRDHKAHGPEAKGRITQTLGSAFDHHQVEAMVSCLI